MPRFKYQDHLAACSDDPCPTDDYTTCPDAITAYRWVHEPMWSDDFLPNALNSHGCDRPEMAANCGNFALSFFTTTGKARRALRYWRKKLRNRYDVDARFGTAAAEIKLKSCDGVACQPNKSGHFDVHEYEGDRDWTNRVDSTTDLVSDGVGTDGC